MHTSRKEVGMKILVNSMARLKVSKPRSFRLRRWKKGGRRNTGGRDLD